MVIFFLRSSRCARHTTEQLRQGFAVDVNRSRSRRRRRQSEDGAVQPLVENAHAVALEPKNLQSRRPTVREDKEYPAFLRILPHPLARRLRHPVEPIPHVHRFRAKEDPNSRRNHDAGSNTASNRRRASGSNVAGIARRRPPLSSSSNRTGTVDRPSSISGSVLVGDPLPFFTDASDDFAAGSLGLPSCHFQNVKLRGLIPSSPANSFAVSPLSFHRATRFAHSSRSVRMTSHYTANSPPVSDGQHRTDTLLRYDLELDLRRDDLFRKVDRPVGRRRNLWILIEIVSARGVCFAYS
jgi:hypothetical protein